MLPWIRTFTGRIAGLSCSNKNITATFYDDLETMAEYTFSMKDVFSTCISRNTLDEAPMAYKSIDEIIEFIGPTAEITERIKPVFNFKAP